MKLKPISNPSAPGHSCRPPLTIILQEKNLPSLIKYTVLTLKDPLQIHSTKLIMVDMMEFI